jgi:hypothetical protein
MSGSPYASTPIQWRESSQILAMGRLAGECTGMLEERKFHVGWVSANHGVAIASTEWPGVVPYKGDAEKISRSRQSFSIFSSTLGRLWRFSGRFLPSSLHHNIERPIKSYSMKTFYTEHRQIWQYPIMDIQQ